MKRRGAKELEKLKQFRLEIQEATSKNDAITEKTVFSLLVEIILLMIANK